MGHRKHKHNRLRHQLTENPVAFSPVVELPIKRSQATDNIDNAGCLKLFSLFFVCYFIFAIGIYMIVDADRDVLAGTIEVTSVEYLDDGSVRLGYGENRTLTTTDNIEVEVGDALYMYYKKGLFGGYEVVGVKEANW